MSPKSHSGKTLRSYRFIYLPIFIFLAALLISKCSNESGLETLGIPHVETTSPSDHAENVAVNTVVSATFSEAMEPSSINDSTFTVFRDSISVFGRINYFNGTAFFNPAANLEANSTYRARITAIVRDMDGYTMDKDFEWSFSTGSSGQN